MTRRAGTVRFRLTFWYATALALILLTFAGSVYLFAQRGLRGYVSRQLAEDYSAIEKMAREEPDELEELEEHGVAGLFRVEYQDRLLFQTAQWQRLGLGEALSGVSDDGELTDRAKDGRQYRVRIGSFGDGDRQVRIAAAADEQPVRAALRQLRLVLIVTCPFAIALSVLGGYILAGRLLAPVGAMAAKAREITAERLCERLPNENPRDEFGQLAQVFNHTLARLEDSFVRLRRFTADASHEFRTPLTAIRSVGEVALQENGDIDRYREAIGSMLEEVGRLTRLVDSLLLLTRADAATANLALERLNVAALARDVVEHVRPLAEERSQTIAFDEGELGELLHGPIVVAERVMLRHALVNLLDNAVKYSPPDAEIRVSVSRGSTGTIEIAVSDHGPGIPREEQRRIFERFYRIDKARSGKSGGTGLGLSIARWAVEANGGCVEVQSEPGQGATFRIVLRQAG